MFSYEFCKTFNNTFLTEQFRAAASESIWANVLKYHFCKQHSNKVLKCGFICCLILNFRGVHIQNPVKYTRFGFYLLTVCAKRFILYVWQSFFLKFPPCSCLFVHCPDTGIIDFTVYQLFSNPRVDPQFKIKSKSIYQYQTDHTSLK